MHLKFICNLLIAYLCSCILIESRSQAQQVKLRTSEGFIKTNDSVKLYYKLIGAGKDTIVVFHGGGFGSSYLISDLSPLAAHHCLLFFDQAGTGFSTVVRDTKRLSIHRFVEDVEMVRKHFHFNKMKILAHSNGGLLAGYYATVFPNRMESMLLINPTAASQNWAYINRYDSISKKLLSQNRKMYLNAPADTLKACWDYYMIWARAKFPSPMHSRRIWGDVCHCNQQNLLNPYLFYSLQSMGAWDLTQALSNVKAPTLILAGDLDETPVEAWQEWKNSLPNSQLIIIPGTGHLPYVDKPSVFFAAAELFYQNRALDSSIFQLNSAGFVLPGDLNGSLYQQARAQIIQIENELMHRIQTKNWNSVAEMYSNDAKIFAPGSPPLSGQKAIASFWHSVSNRGMHSIELQLMDLTINGNQLTAFGKYAMSNSNNGLIDIGKFIALYRKENKQWHLYTDMFNSSLETRSPVEIPDYLTILKKE